MGVLRGGWVARGVGRLTTPSAAADDATTGDLDITTADPVQVGRVVCARAPSLISVHDLGWLRVGDMMVDGVIPLGEALRPLCL